MPIRKTTESMIKSLNALHFKESAFIDNTIYEISQKFLEEYKTSDEGTLGTRLSNSYTIVSIIPLFFGNATIATITKEYIRRGILEHYDALNQKTFPQLVKFIYYLIESNKVMDVELYRIKHLKIRFYSAAMKKEFINVLTEANPERFQYIILKNGRKCTFYMDIDSVEIRTIFIEFLSNYNRASDNQINRFCSNFMESLSPLVINDILDFNYKSFELQFQYFKDSPTTKGSLSILVSFYLFIRHNYNEKLFQDDSIVDPIILQRSTIVPELQSGFMIVPYNSLDPVPTYDKWLLSYSVASESNAARVTTSSVTIDFTKIDNPIYRMWAKSFLWLYDVGLYTKRHSQPIINYFLNYIWELKTGNTLTIYTQKTQDVHIQLNEIIAFKNHILTIKHNSTTIKGYIYTVRSFLSHISSMGLDSIENGIFYHLTYNGDNSFSKTKAVPKEELEQISIKMSKDALTSPKVRQFYAMYFLALNTEFRASQIVSLEYDCVKEASKRNEFVVVSKSKTSAGEKLEQSISLYVKRQIDEIIKFTAEYRANCTDANLSKMLFLVPSTRSGAYSLINTDSFNSYLKSCCTELGLPAYTIGNLRDSHMTMAEEYIIRNSLSDVELRVLSGHTSTNTTTRHYIDTQLTELLESVHGVVIGNVDLKGQILKTLDSPVKEENKVSASCGYCNSSKCGNYSYLDCMMCKDFITTIDRIPYYKEQIAVIDKKIGITSILHDKEDLINIKILLIGYMKALMSLKEGK